MTHAGFLLPAKDFPQLYGRRRTWQEGSPWLAGDQASVYSTVIMPKRLGRYKLKTLLGKGAVGEVYLATMASEVGLSKPCIVKVVKPHLQEVDRVVNHFVDEMHILSRLHHPNIVNAFEFGEADGKKFVAMEYIEGLSLDELQRLITPQEKPIPLPFALFILIQVARGLNYLHDPKANGQMSIIHRDLAPQNVLISKNAEIKIADFGLAKSDINISESKDGSVKGHIRHMAPEQARGHKLTTSADIFSMGVLAYELFCGQPFFDFNNLGLAEAIREVSGYCLEKHPVHIPNLAEPLQRLLNRMLHEDPDVRLQRTLDCIEQFSEALLPKSTDSVEPEFREFVRELMTRRPEKHPGFHDEITASLESVHLAPPLPAPKTISYPSPPPDPSISLKSEEVQETPKNLSPNLAAAAFDQMLKKQRRKLRFRSWLSIKGFFKLALIFFFGSALIVIGLEEGFIPEKPFEAISRFAEKVWSEQPGSSSKKMGSSHISNVPSGQTKVFVDSNPRGARVSIDGKPFPNFTPFDFSDLEPNKIHQIVIQKTGYQTYQERFSLEPGEQKIVVVTLKKKKR